MSPILQGGGCGMSFTFRFLKPGDPYYPNWVAMRRRTSFAWLAFAAWPLLAVLLGGALLVVGLPGGPLLWGAGLALVFIFVVRQRQVNWPCPRCGLPFYRAWWGYRACANHCRHCGLPEYAPHESF
jgi:hypothetical protein